MKRWGLVHNGMCHSFWCSILYDHMSKVVFVNIVFLGGGTVLNYFKSVVQTVYDICEYIKYIAHWFVFFHRATCLKDYDKQLNLY